MKRILTTFLMAVGMASPFAVHLAAQTNPAVADIPFDFVVSQRTLPAGRYDIQQWTVSGPAFAIRDHSGHSVFMQFAANERGNPERPGLTFACYGKVCVLGKITPPHSVTAYTLSQDSIEKNLHRTLGMASIVSVELGGR
jgi:hypothetical protein